MPAVSSTGGAVSNPPGGTPTSTIPDSGPVTWMEIYQLLLQQGWSTAQAIGIMANAINESNGNPEAVGDNGTSFGFVQFHSPGYNTAGLVTGNPQTDIRTQIAYLAKVISPAALQGSTPAEVAGNFAAHFEECVGCQSGGAQYNSRVANAATVAGWVSAGNWPTTSLSTVGSGSAGTGSTGSGTSNSTCLIAAPSVNLIFFNLGGQCLLGKSQARAIIGAGILVGGVVVMGVGLLVLAAFGLKSTGAGAAAGKAAGTALEFAGGAAALAGAPEVGAPVAAAGASVKGRAGRAGQYAQQKRATKRTAAAKRRSDEDAQERHTARQYQRQPRARANLARDEDRQPAPF